MMMLLNLFGCDALLLHPCDPQPWAEVSAGKSHVCVLDDQGEATCSPTTTVASPPAGPLHGLTGGQFFACALDADGKPTCWGDPDSSWDSAILPPDQTFSDLNAGTAYACGLDTGTLSCWGLLQETIGSEAVDLTPPADLVDTNVFSTGVHHICALDTTGALRCWGQSGDAIQPDPGTYRRVAAGDAITCAQADDLTVSCWGDAAPDATALAGVEWDHLEVGASGVCGWGREQGQVCALTEDLSVPEQPTGLSLSIGSNYGCALDESGFLSCFGSGLPPYLPGDDVE